MENADVILTVGKIGYFVALSHFEEDAQSAGTFFVLRSFVLGSETRGIPLSRL